MEVKAHPTTTGCEHFEDTTRQQVTSPTYHEPCRLRALREATSATRRKLQMRRSCTPSPPAASCRTCGGEKTPSWEGGGGRCLWRSCTPPPPAPAQTKMQAWEGGAGYRRGPPPLLWEGGALSMEVLRPLASGHTCGGVASNVCGGENTNHGEGTRHCQPPPAASCHTCRNKRRLCVWGVYSWRSCPPSPPEAAPTAIVIGLKRYLQLSSGSKNCWSECAAILDDFRVEKSRRWNNCEN